MQLTTYVEPELAEQARATARDDSRTVAAVLRLALVAYLNRRTT